MIEIRPAEPTDASELISLAAEVGREPGDWLLTTDDVARAADERRYLKAVRRHPDAAVFVAVDGERSSVACRLPGTRIRRAHTSPISASWSPRAIGAGASGGCCSTRPSTWARAVGIRKLELHVFPWNVPAIRLYEEFGFEREGLRRGHYQRDGDDVDALLMAYHLPSGEESPPSPAP